MEASVQEHPTGVFCLLSLPFTLYWLAAVSHIKDTPWFNYFSSPRPQASSPDCKPLPDFPFPHPPLSIGMPATAIYATQVSAGGYYPSTHGYSPVSPPPTPLSEALVNTPYHNERPSVKLKIPCGKSNIVNSVVVNASGQSLYSISSNSKRTIFVACKNDAEVATVEWNRSNPRMVFRRKKMRCKEWLPLARPETESRILAHGDSQFIWVHKSSASGYLIPANRSGLAVARWRIRSHSDELDLEIFQEALVEPGLLEAIVISVVLLRSGRSLGDTIETMSFSDPKFGIGW